AQAPQPQLAFLFGLVRTNLHDAALALQLVGHVVRAPIRHLDDMPAEARAERLADLADLELRELLLELRHERARADPAEIAAVGRRNRILGDRARDRPELVTPENLLADADQALLDRVVVHDLVGRQQDMPRAHLILHHALDAAHVVEPHDMQSAAALDRLGDVSGLHVDDHVHEQRRQRRALAPAEAAALERGLRIGIRDRELREILAVLEPLVDLVDFRARGFEAARLVRDIDQDVRDVVVELVELRRPEPREALVDLSRRNRDPRDHVALLELIEDQVLAPILTVGRVVDAFRGERSRELLEREAEIGRDVRERLVQNLVADLDPDPPSPLHLHLLDDQLLEDLSFEHRKRRQLRALLWRQLRLLLAERRDDQRKALLELALQDDAVVDDRGDAVEENTARAELAGLCRRVNAGEHREQGCRGGKCSNCRFSHRGFAPVPLYPRIPRSSSSSGEATRWLNPLSSSWTAMDVSDSPVRRLMKRRPTTRRRQQHASNSQPRNCSS